MSLEAGVSCSVLFSSALIADTIFILSLHGSGQNLAFQFSGIAEAMVKYPDTAGVLVKKHHDSVYIWGALLEFWRGIVFLLGLEESCSDASRFREVEISPIIAYESINPLRQR